MTEAAGGPHAYLNELSEADARTALARCCGAARWVNSLLEHRPYTSEEDLLGLAADIWVTLKESDYLEAFSHHPKIGANLAELARKFPNTAQLSAAEQRGVSEASDGTLQALSELNLAYEQRFGFIFIVCAKGKTASEMRHLLERRINNPKPVELELAAVEQGKITRLRLEQLGT